MADRPSSPAPVTLKPVMPMETSEVNELMMERTTNRRKDTSTTEETTRRQVLKELVEMTTRRKEVSTKTTTTRRKSLGTVRRGSRPLRTSVLRRRLDSVVTQSRPAASILPNSTPRPRMVRPSYSGAGGRDRVGQWERKVSSSPKKPLRRMKIRGGGPSNR